jgi:hypothetical protein
MDRRTLLLTLPVLVAGCTKNYFTKDTTATVTPTPVLKEHKIEFRVLGTVSSVDIAYSTTEEGANLLTTNVPWFALSHTTSSEIFLSISASSFDFGDLEVQIFVDGVLFREARASGFEPKVSVSGSWSE